MIELFEQDIQLNDRQSSKGNQLKWQGENGGWYKADYTGYEGFAEYMVSCLLEYSSLEKDEDESEDRNPDWTGEGKNILR